MTDIQRTQVDENTIGNGKQVNSLPCKQIECPIIKIQVSQEQLQREYNYFLAQQILESMLQRALITEDEFNKITILNRKTFSPALAEIMP